MRELARQVSMSPPTTAERVRRLEEAGIIAGYHAEICPERLALGVHGYMVINNIAPENGGILPISAKPA